MSLLRLGVFIGLVWCGWVLIRAFSGWLLLLAIALAGLFIGCLNLYFRWKDKRSLLEKQRFVVQNELAVLAGETNAFPDGARWLDSGTYLHDLDIFGPQSLFHLLNRTTTARGAAALAGRLREPLLQPGAITEQQQAIRVLSGQPALRQQLTATGLLIGSGEIDFGAAGLREWLETPPRLYPRVAIRVVILLLSAYNVYAFYALFTGSYVPIIAGLVVSRLVLSAYGQYIRKQHRLIANKHALLDQYAGILAVFNGVETADSPLLRRLQNQTSRAHAAIRRLSKLTSAFDQRLNLLVSVLLNSFFFYDMQCMIALERWKAANRSELLTWIEAVAMVESLNSLATYAFNHPENIYPEPVDGATLFIRSERLAHPLIPAGRRIANDLTIGEEERLILVTGSNMAGKTTFLRTLGVNLLMAECGLPVCATAFVFTPLQLLTSLRISDSLQEQTSYFMAELKKLQQIIRSLGTGVPALVLIDEILRGTNSEDKTYGSEQFIRRLLDYPALSLFATHDLTLGRLEKELPGAIRNYCFESIIEGNELRFDYRLQRGIAHNRNASFLMQQMGII
jgi:MutS-like protein